MLSPFGAFCSPNEPTTLDNTRPDHHPPRPRSFLTFSPFLPRSLRSQYTGMKMKNAIIVTEGSIDSRERERAPLSAKPANTRACIYIYIYVPDRGCSGFVTRNFVKVGNGRLPRSRRKHRGQYNVANYPCPAIGRASSDENKDANIPPGDVTRPLRNSPSVSGPIAASRLAQHREFRW